MIGPLTLTLQVFAAQNVVSPRRPYGPLCLGSLFAWAEDRYRYRLGALSTTSLCEILLLTYLKITRAPLISDYRGFVER
jgi:hypothetical protein